MGEKEKGFDENVLFFQQYFQLCITCYMFSSFPFKANNTLKNTGQVMQTIQRRRLKKIKKYNENNSKVEPGIDGKLYKHLHLLCVCRSF